MSTYDHQLYNSVLNIKPFKQGIQLDSQKTLTLIHISHAREVFHEEVIFFTWAVPYVTI